MVGFTQTQVDTRLKNFIKEMKPGSFLLFKRNIQSLEQVKNLNEQLRVLSALSSSVHPFIAVDQEGGPVSRIPTEVALPNALALGQTNSAPLAETYGEELGRLLVRLGFNMNLAPVLDLSDPQQPSFIGVRSFGHQPDRVGDLGLSISKGMITSKVIPTAKHFPGMGSSTHDPHSTLVTRITSLEDFMATDLKPFQRFSSLGGGTAVMLSHLSYPVLDNTNVPALFSEKIVTELLRNKLGFKGIVLTDDLMMEGASQFAKPEEAALMALKAGADIVMVTWSIKAQENAIRRVRQAVLKKELSLESLDEKLKRILYAKALSSSSLLKDGRNLAQQPNDSGKLKEIEQNILDSNIRLQAEKFNRFSAAAGFCVFSTSQNFLNSFKAARPTQVKYFLISKYKTGSNLETMIKKKVCSQTVVAVHGRKSASLVHSLSPSEKSQILLVNLSAPMVTLDEAAFKAVINLYFSHAQAGQKIAQQILKTQLVSKF